MSKLKEGLSKEEIKLLNRMYWRSQNYAMAWNFSRICGTSTAWILYPYISWLYPDSQDKDKKIAALKRETAFFNTTPQLATLCYSLFASMEKEAAADPDFDVASIQAVRAGIQGPLAGIGDSIFWVTWRVIITGIAIPFALSGSVLGPLIFIFGFNIPGYILKYYLTFIGYKMGINFINETSDTGIIEKITNVASVIGMIMIGGMIAQQVSVPLNLVLTLNDITLNVMEALNGILPGLVELSLVIVVITALKKKVNTLFIVVSIIVISILFAFLGIF